MNNKEIYYNFIRFLKENRYYNRFMFKMHKKYKTDEEILKNIFYLLDRYPTTVFIRSFCWESVDIDRYHIVKLAKKWEIIYKKLESVENKKYLCSDYGRKGIIF